MKKVYNKFLSKECFIKAISEDTYNKEENMYHLADEKGNTIWNGNFLWFPASAVTLL